MVHVIDRLIELDEQETLRQRERVNFLSLFGAVLEALPDGLILTDVNGIIIMINERTEFMFGYSRSNLIGCGVDMLLPKRHRASHARQREIYNKFNIHAHTRTMGVGTQLMGIRADGHEFPADIMLSRMVLSNGIYNLALVRYSPGIAKLIAATHAGPHIQ